MGTTLSPRVHNRHTQCTTQILKQTHWVLSRPNTLHNPIGSGQCDTAQMHSHANRWAAQHSLSLCGNAAASTPAPSFAPQTYGAFRHFPYHKPVPVIHTALPPQLVQQQQHHGIGACTTDCRALCLPSSCLHDQPPHMASKHPHYQFKPQSPTRRASQTTLKPQCAPCACSICLRSFPSQNRPEPPTKPKPQHTGAHARDSLR
jgi:hypothetical protein